MIYTNKKMREELINYIDFLPQILLADKRYLSKWLKKVLNKGVDKSFGIYTSKALSGYGVKNKNELKTRLNEHLNKSNIEASFNKIFIDAHIDKEIKEPLIEGLIFMRIFTKMLKQKFSKTGFILTLSYYENKVGDLDVFGEAETEIGKFATFKFCKFRKNEEIIDVRNLDDFKSQAMLVYKILN